MPKKNKKLIMSRSVNDKKSIEECTNVIVNSSFWMNLLTSILELTDGSYPLSILCYGLGNFLESIQAKYQLSLLLAIKEAFEVTNCYVYDPAFTDTERTYLTNAGCDSICENEEGKRKLSPYTFVFMPHCPRQLLNNLLWANWDKDVLTSCIFVCNSIDQTITSTPDRFLYKASYYIQKVYPYVIERPFPDDFIYDDIFNDMSLHIFPSKKLNEVEDFWKRDEEPSYDNIVLGFITKFECMSFRS